MFFSLFVLCGWCDFETMVVTGDLSLQTLCRDPKELCESPIWSLFCCPVRAPVDMEWFRRASSYQEWRWNSGPHEMGRHFSSSVLKHMFQKESCLDTCSQQWVICSSRFCHWKAPAKRGSPSRDLAGGETSNSYSLSKTCTHLWCCCATREDVNLRK